MDFRTLLHTMSTITEGETKETEKGREHKGQYGKKYGKEDVRDQYGHKIGKVNTDTDDKKDEPKKKGRGRPKKGSDDSGEVKQYDTKSLGDVFGGGKKPSKEVGKKSVKHSLKEYIEEAETALNESEVPMQNNPISSNNTMGPVYNSRGMYLGQWDGQRLRIDSEVWKKWKDENGEDWASGTVHSAKNMIAKGRWTIRQDESMSEDMTNQSPIQIKPASQTNTQVIQQGDKTLGTVTNPQLAQQIKKSLGDGEMTLNPDDQKMSEGLAQTLSKMHESLQANGVVLTEGELKQTMIKFFDELELGPKGYNIKPAVELHDKGLASNIINKTLAHGRFKGMSGSFKDQLRDAALEHFGFTNYEESLEEGDLIPHPSKDMHTTHGMNSNIGDPNVFKPSRMQTPNKPIAEPTPWKVDPINAATDRAINFISGLGKSKSKLESTEMKDIQLEGWEKELNNLLNEGITVSTSTGQQGAPDSVSINATDNDANELLTILRQSGMGVFGGNEKPAMTPYGGMSQGETEPTGTGTEPEMSPDVVGDGNDMLSLLKKMTGLSAGPVGQEPEGTASSDYEDEEGDEHSDSAEYADVEDSGEEEKTDEGYNAFTSKVAKAKSDNIPDKNQKISVGGKQYPVKEDDMEESNAFVDKLRKTPKGEKFSIGGKQYTDTSNIEESHDHESCNECGGMMYEGHTCEEQMNEGMDNEYSPEMQERIKNSTPQELSKMAYELAGDPSRYSHEYKKLEATRSLLRGTTKHEESVGEGFSNDAGGDAMGDTELMQLKELLSMGNDLHKLKQRNTVGNPTLVSMAESLAQWKRLSGIK